MAVPVSALKQYRDVFAYLKAADEHAIDDKSPDASALPRRFLELDVQAPLDQCRAKLDVAIADLIARKSAAKGAPRWVL